MDRLLARLRGRWPKLAELVLFCAVGATGVAVDFAVFYPVVEFGALDPRLAAIPAFLVAVSWNYMLNRHFTFAGARNLALPRSYLTFVTVCTLGVGIRIGVMHLLMVHAGWSHKPLIWLTSLVGIAAATAANFLGSKYLAFRGPS
jgi:putative flippase GtrA